MSVLTNTATETLKENIARATKANDLELKEQLEKILRIHSSPSVSKMRADRARALAAPAPPSLSAGSSPSPSPSAASSTPPPASAAPSTPPPASAAPSPAASTSSSSLSPAAQSVHERMAVLSKQGMNNLVTGRVRYTKPPVRGGVPTIPMFALAKKPTGTSRTRATRRSRRIRGTRRSRR
jgi:hypothetical protein